MSPPTEDAALGGRGIPDTEGLAIREGLSFGIPVAPASESFDDGGGISSGSIVSLNTTFDFRGKSSGFTITSLHYHGTSAVCTTKVEKLKI